MSHRLTFAFRGCGAGPARRRIGACALALAASCLALYALVASRPKAEPVSLASALYASFCTPVPAGAVVARDVRATDVVEVVVPATPENPVLASSTSRVSAIVQGDVVEFHVRATRSGALSVHGLSDMVLVDAGQSATVRFKAIYSGRFSLHFHGADGSHFEIWVLNIFDHA